MERYFETILFGLMVWLCAVILLGIFTGNINSRPTRVLNSAHSYETTIPLQ